MLDGGCRRPSNGYAAEEIAAGFNPPLPPPPPNAMAFPFGAATLPALRGFVGDFATDAGLAAGRVADWTLAVNETATNSIRHGGGRGMAHLWLDDHHVICQVSDGGRLGDPLAGRVLPPANDKDGGLGLLIVNDVCDLVLIHRRAAGTAVRLHIHAGPSPAGPSPAGPSAAPGVPR